MNREPSLTEQVLEQLREDIVTWEYGINDLITEADISKRFQVSKTPAREALSYLCMEGLLEKLPHKGYLVKLLSATELQQLFQFRMILENAAVTLAVRYASDEELAYVKELAAERVSPNEPNIDRKYNELNARFHMAVASLSRNHYLISALGTTLNQLRRPLVLDWKHADSNRLLAAHSVLADALINRDLAAAQQNVLRECDYAESRIYAQKGVVDGKQ